MSEGRPFDANDKMNLTIQTQDVPASVLDKSVLAVGEQTGGAKGGMPPGSIFLYVFDAGQ